MSDFPLPEVWMPHRVSYGETDCMGVVYHAEYLHFFERSRNEFIRNTGISYREVEEKGVYVPVREASCRYRRPVKYDDLIWVRAGVSKWGRASFTFIYEIWNEDKTVLHATGFTEHAVINKEGRPVPVPEWFRNLFL
ncbi:acyl-CoA thioesterase [Desulfovibrio sp. OttesenSCG-928-F07]|nr:acyl-CoA thioesterase [Desulfovibrio sp. OttesenSCG-928-F07]